MTPSFAVVGHPNKGKSSIVATLAEDSRIAISDIPGTTRRAQRFTFRIGDKPLYTLIDTPGFQRAAEVLAWLQARADSADARAAAVTAFVAEHRDDDRFVDEVELLRPIIDGAGILYVVDGAKPYGAEYEIEMQVLQWTGQPRMALINRIGEGDYIEQWRSALGQHFSIVREFDALHADFDKRVQLLRAFAELDHSARSPIDAAVSALQAERERRRRGAAAAISDGLISALAHSEQAPLKADATSEERDKLAAQLSDKLRACVRDQESRSRRAVQALYRHEALAAEVSGESLLTGDLFTEASWQLFGLSRQQLLVSGVFSGALAGGGIDVLLGGASLLLGAGIGAVIGGASAWFGGEELARIRVLGQPIGGDLLEVGPIKAPNFPWVWLGRALLHHRLVSETNHARRRALSLELDGAENVMDHIDAEVRREITKRLAKITRDGTSEQERRALIDAVQTLLS